MNTQTAKTKFIETWGKVGAEWGITRTMAHIHALLLLSDRPMCTDEIMQELNIARGSASMTLRELLEWELVAKDPCGERKEFYVAHKDMLHIIRQVIIHRKARELQPLLTDLNDIHDLEGDPIEAARVEQVVSDIRLFAQKADSVLEHLTRADAAWMMNIFMKMVR